MFNRQDGKQTHTYANQPTVRRVLVSFLLSYYNLVTIIVYFFHSLCLFIWESILFKPKYHFCDKWKTYLNNPNHSTFTHVKWCSQTNIYVTVFRTCKSYIRILLHFPFPMHQRQTTPYNNGEGPPVCFLITIPSRNY